MTKKISLGISLIFVIMFCLGIISAYTYSNPSYGLYNNAGGTGSFASYSSGSFDSSLCTAGTDFIIQLSPFECEPSVVRSDLLEEQDVTVYCKIVATQINPLINVEAIRYITISGEYPSQIRSIGYFPSQSALGYTFDDSVNNPVLQNMGYVAITLRQNSNESSMPDYVEGNMTATLKYDVENAFGVGSAEFYLPVLSDDDFSERINQYSFWEGRGYLRAESVGDDSATISIYSDINSASESSKQRVTQFSIDEGETSNEIYIPGFSSCLASLKIKLNDVEEVDTRVRLKINSDYVEVSDGGSFLDEKCKVKSINKDGLNQRVSISCKEDDKTANFNLVISPSVKLKVNEEETKDYTIGDYLYTSEDNTQSVYLGYVGSKKDTGKLEDLFVVLVARPQYNPTGLSDEDVSSIAKRMNMIYSDIKKEDDALDVLNNGIGKLFGGLISFGTWSVKGENFHALNFKEGEISSGEEFLGSEVRLRGYSDGVNNDLYTVINEEYTFEKYSGSTNLFAGETYSLNKDNVDTGLKLEYSSIGKPKIFLKYYTIGGDVVLSTFYGDNCDNHIKCSEYVLDIDGINSNKGDYEEFFENTVSGRIYVSSNKLTLKKIDFNSDSSEKYMDYYNSAINDFETILNSYSGESDGSGNSSETYGENALYEEILLSKNLGRMKNMRELCQKFAENYPDSYKPMDMCEDDYAISNSGVATREVYINGRNKIISFEGIYEPGYTEYGAEVSVKGPNGKINIYQLRKGEPVYLDGLRDSSSSPQQDIYVYNDGSTKIVYYLFSGDKWYWSLDKVTWKNASMTDGVSQINKQIIEKLKDYNEADGKAYLTSDFVGATKEITSEESSSSEYIILESVDEDSAKVGVYVTGGGLFSKLSSTYTLDLDESDSFGSQFIFTLTDTNVEKVAKVSVVPSFNYQKSNTTFEFKVGIEKRAIQLSDEQINNRINTLNNSIENIQKISNVLNDTNKILGYSCLATGGVLTVKNFIANSNGKSIARQEVMQGRGGWNEFCQSEVAKTDSIYSSVDDCFFENSDKIDAQVNEVYNAIQSQDQRIKAIQESVPSTSFLTNNVIDQKAFMEDYSTQAVNSLNGIGTNGIFSVEGKENLNLSEMKEILSYEGWGSGNYNTEELREIELYSNLVKTTTDSDSKKLYENRLYSLLYDARVNAESYVIQESFKDETGLSSSSSVMDLGEKKTTTIPVTSLETFSSSAYANYQYGVGSPTILGGEYVYAIRDQNSGKRYLVVYDNDGIVKNTYTIEGNSLVLYAKRNSVTGEIQNTNPLGLSFKKYDSSTYENEYKNPEVRYYEEEPYVGYPAIVPLDTKKGWYAATKPLLGVGSSIASYDTSGKLNSFWLCNVGENGLQEFSNSDYGDDICEQINLGTGQTYNQFSGLSESETTKLVNNAVKTIEAAQTAYKNEVSKVKLNGVSYNVGEPAVSVASAQCTDYMSPSDCKILFNVCDPVVCPNSRCDFGGAYPVKDVVQTGIIGSIALCAPNAREGIVLPVCTTGVQAGLDSWVSVQESYRDCLQENLDSGSTVGICDQIHSVYVCEFFWRQALPLAKVSIPKVLNALAGENTRGGGEYLGLQNAWDNAKGSLDYFTQYYADESYKAFKVRSVDEAGGEVCKNFASVVYPSSGELLDSLTTPRSPPQFTGSFDETSLTTTTNPPTSHYKVYYHIYAGTDSGAYYQVYLSGGSSSSYYQDTSLKRVAGSGYVNAGEYASESVDFTAPSGYTKMCIVVNGQEECGFNQVSTSFAVNYVNDLYLEEQSTASVTTEAECVSGTASIYSLLNPNAESIVDDLIDPALYQKGIIRICATENPGKGTDPYYGTEDSRWRDVGYCGDSNMRCWIDTDSVKEAITALDIEDSVLNDTAQSYLDALTQSGDYISNDQYKINLSNIKSESDALKRINLINEIIDSVFFNNQKAELFFLRGKAYGNLSITEFSKLEEIRTDVIDFEDVYDEETDKEVIYIYDDGSTKKVYYRFTNEWVWSTDQINWYGVTVSEGVSQVNKQIIEKLKDYNEADGEAFLIGEGAVKGESSICDNSLVGENILSIARDYIGGDTTRLQNGEEVYDNVCATFVSNVLIDAGSLPGFSSCSVQTTPYRDAIVELIDLFEKNNNFAEVPKEQWKTGLRAGDIVIWGGSGSFDPDLQHITIFAKYDGNGIAVVHDGGQSVNIVEKTYSNPFGSDWYITHVWRAGCSEDAVEEIISSSEISSSYINLYESKKSLFEKYASENLPQDMGEVKFKALLVSISQWETGIGKGYNCGINGIDSCSDWLMGYTDGNSYPTKYRGAEKQIDLTSGLLKEQLDNSQGSYSICASLNGDEKLRCVLAVYNGGSNNPNYDYANRIVSTMNQWEVYFSEGGNGVDSGGVGDLSKLTSDQKTVYQNAKECEDCTDNPNLFGSSVCDENLCLTLRDKLGKYCESVSYSVFGMGCEEGTPSGAGGEWSDNLTEGLTDRQKEILSNAVDDCRICDDAGLLQNSVCDENLCNAIGERINQDCVYQISGGFHCVAPDYNIDYNDPEYYESQWKEYSDANLGVFSTEERNVFLNPTFCSDCGGAAFDTNICDRRECYVLGLRLNKNCEYQGIRCNQI